MDFVPLVRGALVARRATGAEDLRAALALRRAAFFPDEPDRDDRDPFDATCDHVVVERAGRVVATFRYQVHGDGRAAGQGYSGQVYDLAPLAGLPGPMVEMGRFCVAPGPGDPDALRLAWAAMTRIVDGAGARLLFGCTSFAGVDAARFHNAFALLATRHLAPEGLRPGARAAERIDFAAGAFDPVAAQKELPPLLRTYLMMGGWVSDHAAVDREMNTLHVFTGVEIDKIPPTRARLLRALAGPGDD